MIRVLVAALALIGGGTLVAACNDDGGSLSLEEYFERVDELDQAQQDRSTELEDELDALGEDASVDQVADSFQDQIGVLRDFVDDMDDLEPPDEVRETHDEAVRALNAAADQFASALEDFRDAASIEAAFAAFESADLSESEKADDACRELQAIANDNDVGVDLDCGD